MQIPSGGTDGYIAVPGGRVWYSILGADQKAVPLLALHGGPGASHDYLEPLASLAAERPVIFYDQLGSGNSEHPDDASLWTIDRFVEELAQVRATLKLASVHLLGQSWGGAIATEYLLNRHSEGVISLVLSAPLLSAPRWIDDQRALVRELPLDVQDSIKEGEATGNFDSPAYHEAMMTFYRRHLARLDPWPDCLNRTVEKLNLSVYMQMWGPSEFTVTGTLRDYDSVNRLGEPAVPVLFTCGQYDEVTPATLEYFCRNFLVLASPSLKAPLICTTSSVRPNTCASSATSFGARKALSKRNSLRSAL